MWNDFDRSRSDSQHLANIDRQLTSMQNQRFQEAVRRNDAQFIGSLIYLYRRLPRPARLVVLAVVAVVVLSFAWSVFGA